MTEPITTENAAFASRRTGLRGLWRWLLAALALAGILAVFVAMHLRHEQLAYRLLVTPADVAGADPALVRFATSMAKPLYAKNCAACHGADMQGNTAIGAPDLADQNWLWGDGSVRSIERTLLYGIRAGPSKTRNLTEMPAFGLNGQLDEAQVDSLVQYLLKLNHRSYQSGAANEGQEIFYGPASCNDCHSPDAHGNPDYGAPNLTNGIWDNGGDTKSLFDSIYYGRHRIMPAWFGILTLTQIRALAVYIHAVSHSGAASGHGAATPAGPTGAAGDPNFPSAETN